MFQKPTQELILAIVFAILFTVIIIPIHEISHLVFMKVSGVKSKLKIKLLDIEALRLASNKKSLGYVGPKDGNELIFGHNWITKKYRSFLFLLGASGGWGCALTLYIALLFLLKIYPGSTSLINTLSVKFLFYGYMVCNILKGIQEGLKYSVFILNIKDFVIIK